MSKQHYQKGYKGTFCFLPKHSYFYDWLHKSMGRKSYLEINISNKKELSSVVTIINDSSYILSFCPLHLRYVLVNVGFGHACIIQEQKYDSNLHKKKQIFFSKLISLLPHSCFLFFSLHPNLMAATT